MIQRFQIPARLELESGIAVLGTVISIYVKFFGATADTAGTREIAVEVPHQATAGAALDSVVERVPALAKHKLLFAVNEDYVPPETPLRDGDELAIFTAVSGG